MKRHKINEMLHLFILFKIPSKMSIRKCLTCFTKVLHSCIIFTDTHKYCLHGASMLYGPCMLLSECNIIPRLFYFVLISNYCFIFTGIVIIHTGLHRSSVQVTANFIFPIPLSSLDPLTKHTAAEDLEFHLLVSLYTTCLHSELWLTQLAKVSTSLLSEHWPSYIKFTSL